MENTIFCRKCGKEVTKSAAFCPKCGKELITTSSPVQSLEFAFMRHKSLGRLDISHMCSEVSIINSTLKLQQQKIHLYWFKSKPIATIHNIMDIASIRVVRIFDISDMIFGIIFALLGFINPLFFIGAALLIWVGIGKKIEIRKSNGAVLSIPSGNSSACMQLAQVISSINRGIVVDIK